jgi:hypothetical protein
MGSGSYREEQGSYKGNGGSQDITVKLGFTPKSVEVISTNGQVFLKERMKGPFRKVTGSNPTLLSSGLEIIEGGFKVSGNNTALNANGVDYFWESF